MRARRELMRRWWLSSGLVVAMSGAWPERAVAQEPTTSVTMAPSFPRCELSNKDRKRFLAEHGAGLLAIADARYEEAVERFEEALELCSDDEVLWYLARLHERLGDEAKYKRLDELWRAQRTMQGLSTKQPQAPSWVVEARASSPVKMASLELEEEPRTGTYPIPLPQFYRGIDGLERVKKAPLYRFADELSRLSVETSPARAGVTLWLADGTYLGEAPLKELVIPAEVEVVLVVKIDGQQVLVRHVEAAKPRAHQRLFIELP